MNLSDLAGMLEEFVTEGSSFSRLGLADFLEEHGRELGAKWLREEVKEYVVLGDDHWVRDEARNGAGVEDLVTEYEFATRGEKTSFWCGYDCGASNGDEVMAFESKEEAEEHVRGITGEEDNDG